MRTGTVGSFSVRWAGWFSSWLVFEMNTDERRSKVSLPSGFGYSILVQSAAGLSETLSGFVPCSVQGGFFTPTLGSSHCSMPVMILPSVGLFLNHSLKLRDWSSSSFSQLCSKAAG